MERNDEWRRVRKTKKDYFDETELCEQIKKSVLYNPTIEKPHIQIEVREYYQT